MDLWINVLNVLLTGVAAIALTWGLRQRAILLRVCAGLKSLRQGKNDIRLRTSGEDSEEVLESFDSLAEQLQWNGRPSEPVEAPSQWANIVTRMCETLRPSLVTMQSYVTLLAQNHGSPETHQAYVEKLQTQIAGLLRLMESPGNLSKLRQELSGLQRKVTDTEALHTDPTILIVDGENGANQLRDAIATLGIKVLVAPAVDAAAIMALAIRPALVLINANWGDGLGWSVLRTLLIRRDGRCGPIWFYAISAEQQCQLWTPQDVWNWPITDLGSVLPQGWLENPPGLEIPGDSQLAQDVRTLFQQHGWTVAEETPHHVPLLPGTVTIVVDGQTNQPVNYVLVFIEQEIEVRASTFSATFTTGLEKCSEPLSEIVRAVEEHSQSWKPAENT